MPRVLPAISAIGICSFLAFAGHLRAQASDLCSDPADRDFHQCVGRIASYSSWMVVPGDGKTAGPLQSALDGAYSDIEQDWAAKPLQQKYLRNLYFEPAVALALLLLAVLIVRRLFPPVLNADRSPSWPTERILLAVGPLILLTGIGLERWLTYQRLLDDYGEVRARLTPFVRILSPRSAVRLTADPCEFAFGTDAARVARCSQEARSSNRTRSGAERFSDSSLLNGLIGVAQTCRLAQLPPWWASQEREQGLDCLAAGIEPPVIQVRDIAKIGNFALWLTGSTEQQRTSSAALLELPDSFGVRSSTGNLYREKVSLLLGDFGRYRQLYWRTTSLVMGGAVLVLIVFTGTLWRGRTRELIDGSPGALRLQRAALVAGVVFCLLSSVILVAIQVI